MWDSELANDVSPNEVYALCLGDCGEWFYLYPLSEIIYRHDSEFGLCLSSGKWADQIYPPFYKWLGTDVRRERFIRLSWDMYEPPAFIIFPNEIC